MAITKRNIDLKTMERIAEVLKTMAHPIRLNILEILEQAQPMTVTAIMEHTGTEQSLLSHHLTKMKDKGILISHREGKNIYYSLTDNTILKVFDCMENCSLIR